MTSAALVGVLSGGGAIWVAPILLAALFVALWMTGAAEGLGLAAGFAIVTALLCLPVLATGGLLPPTSSPLTSPTALGNLLHPLSKLQLFGVWPAGDFRVDPADSTPTYVLIAVIGVAALGGLYAGWRARGWALLLYLLGALGACALLVAVGSPWVGAKAMATAAPAIPLAAAAGGAALYGSGRRLFGGVVLAAIATGVLWSNALAYRDVNLAPRDQLVELQTIGARIAGQGPTLMTEYEPYGVRHFLRNADPEGASELRRRRVPLSNGRTLPKGSTADTDRFELSGLMVYRTLVLRRSPSQSRPPSPYQPIWRGRFYEVWQRPPGTQGTVVDHLGLGDRVHPSGVPRCTRVLRLAREAGPAGTLAAVRRDPVEAIALARTRHPAAWSSPASANTLGPTAPGEIRARIRVPRAASYEIWLGGSVRPEVDLVVDGTQVGQVRDELNNFGEYVDLGRVPLSAGPHTVEIRFAGADLHPGSGGDPGPIGPLVLSPQDAADTRISYFRSSEASRLCGRPWDWIEAIAPGGEG
jgi:hypothetical protein